MTEPTFEVREMSDWYRSVVVHSPMHPNHDQFCEAARSGWRTEQCGCMQRWLSHKHRCTCCEMSSRG